MIDPRAFAGAVRWRLGKVLRIARWEAVEGVGDIDRRTVAVAAVAALVSAVVVPAAAGGGVALDRGLYRAGVAADSPYYEPLRSDPTFAVREPDRSALESGDLELLVADGRISVARSEKGRAALAEFRETVADFNDRRMAAEANGTAAFPVSVTLEYAERNATEVLAPGAAGDGGNGDGAAGAEGGGGGDGAGGAGDAGTGGTGSDASDGATAGSGTAGAGGGLSGSLAGGTGQGGAQGSPSDISPPFPLRSLVLAFLFVVPLNFVVQAYGSSILGERINRRGELLLVTPVSPVDIVAGKTLPYFGAAVGVATLIAVAIGGGPLSVLAVVPLALLFLSATFLGAMFARSFKELTFVTVTVTVSLTSYAFVPAIFTDVGAVALISPLTLVVRDLGEATVTAGDVVFSTTPPLLSAAVLFALGVGIYREEDMFTQRPVPLKALDALAARISGLGSVAVLSAVLLPFVFVAELLAVALLFALPTEPSVVAILVLVAVIEEVAKSLHVYAGYVHARFSRRLRTALAVGAASGVGFFVGEKLTLLAQLVQLPDLRVGQAALATGTGVETLPAAVALLLAPLALHVVTAAISAVGASRDRSSYAVALAAAIVVHVAYNLTVVIALA